MRKDLTELVFILDKSGSMYKLVEETIKGFNSVLEKQRNVPGDAIVTVILFNHEIKYLHKRVNIQQVELLTTHSYQVDGTTALLDATGSSIDYIGEELNKLREEDRPGKVLFVITTDGLENDSKQYELSEVRDKITHQQDKYSWEFLFLGANFDAIGVAEQMGMKARNAVRYVADDIGMETISTCLQETITCCRTAGHINPDWKEKIEKDFKKRGKRK